MSFVIVEMMKIFMADAQNDDIDSDADDIIILLFVEGDAERRKIVIAASLHSYTLGLSL